MGSILLRLKVFFSTFTFMWRIRHFFSRLRFSIVRRVFRIRIGAEDISISLAILRSIAFTAISSILLSLATALILFSIGYVFIHLKFPVPNIRSIVPFLAETVASEAQLAFDGFLIAVITVIGLFLTLYITNIGAIAGSLYARLSSRLRLLYIRERVGNLYVGFLVFLVMVSLLSLTISILLEFRPNLIILFVGILSAFAVPSFLVLGRRAFQLFDPTLLSNVLFWRILRWSKYASADGFLWRDKSFQDHYRKQVFSALEDLSSLTEVCAKDNQLRSRPLASLLNSLVPICRKYLQMKKKIPHSSLWFQQIPKYRSWFLLPYSRVSLATSTETDIQPELKSDPYGIKSELIGLKVKGLETFIADKSLLLAIKSVDSIGGLFSTLARIWEIPFAIRELREITDLVTKSVQPLKFEEGRFTESKSNLTEKLALIDYLGLIPISILLAYSKSIENTDLSRIGTSIEMLDWKNPKSIYSLDLPPILLERMEFIHKRVEFELIAEKKVVSSSWYLKQLVFQSIAYSLEECLNKLLDEAHPLFESKSGWDNIHFLLYEIQLISRGLEFGNKFQAHLHNFIRLSEDLEHKRVEKTIPWPEFNWDEVERRLSDFMKDLYVRYSRLIPYLSLVETRKDIPDYFSRAVHLAGEKCFKSLINNEYDLFSKIFPNYFMGSLQVYELLRKETADWLTDQAIPAMSQPIIDLIEISGYSKFFAEFHDDPKFWDLCKGIWDEYLALDMQRLDLIGLLISYNSKLFLITNRSVLRTQWKININRLLDEMPRVSKPVNSLSVIPCHITYVDHPSVLIRVFGGINASYGSFYGGIDIFVHLYLREINEAESIDFGNVRDIKEAIDRWDDNSEEDPEI